MAGVIRRGQGALQRAQGRHRFHGLTRNRSNVLEIAVVVQDRQPGAFGNGCKHQIGRANRAMLATVRQEQHDVGRAVEVRLVRWDERQRLDELFMHATRITSAEQGFQVEHAAPGESALPLQFEELTRDGWSGQTGVDTVVQQVRQALHAWLSTSSLVSSISPS